MQSSIPVDVEQLVFVAMGSPRAKLRNRQTGEVATARGQRITVVPVAALARDESNDEDDGDILRVQVLGEPEGIKRGMPLRVTGLVARPYDFKDDRTGEQKFGITYWAQSIAPATAPATAPAPAAGKGAA